MEALPPGSLDPRTGRVVEPFYGNWTTHPNNPMSAAVNKQQFAPEPMVREPAE
jgi:hypothetical protein